MVTTAEGTDGTWSERLWDLTAAKTPLSLVDLSKHEGRIDGVTFSRDERWLVTTAEGTDATWSERLWDMTAVKTPLSPVDLSKHEGRIYDIRFSQDERWLVTKGEDDTAKLWGLTTRDPWSSPVLAFVTLNSLLNLDQRLGSVKLGLEDARSSRIQIFWTLPMACIFVVIFAFVCGMRQRMLENDIQTVETLNWSWARGRKGVLVGAPGLITGVFLAFWFGAIDTVSSNRLDSQFPAYCLLFALLCGFIPGLVLATVGALRQGVAELKTGPNQGTLLSIRSAAFLGVVSGLSTAVILALIPLLGNLAFHVGFDLIRALKVTLTLGLVSTLIVGSWFGGVDVLNHYVLRLTLYLFGYTPFNYVRFLDYAAKDLRFLQKVGGGYIFIHRILLEHFAAMEDEVESNAQDTLAIAAPTPFESVSGK